MTSNGFLPMITQPTRVTDTTKSLIDNIFTNAFTKESVSGTVLIEFADHLTQFASICKQNEMPPTNSFYKRSNKNWKDEDFLRDLSSESLASESDDPSVKLDVLMTKLTSCVDKHLPYKKITKREMKMKSKPWITPIILKKIEHRNSLFVRKKADPENLYLKLAYNRFRNSVNRDIRVNKEKHYNEYFINCQNNMKKTWKGINELISSRVKSPVNISQIQNDEDTLVNDPNNISNSFNDFFVNVGTNLDKKNTQNTNLSLVLSQVKGRKWFYFQIDYNCRSDVVTPPIG